MTSSASGQTAPYTFKKIAELYPYSYGTGPMIDGDGRVYFVQGTPDRGTGLMVGDGNSTWWAVEPPASSMQLLSVAADGTFLYKDENCWPGHSTWLVEPEVASRSLVQDYTSGDYLGEGTETGDANASGEAVLRVFSYSHPGREALVTTRGLPTSSCNVDPRDIQYEVIATNYGTGENLYKLASPSIDDAGEVVFLGRKWLNGQPDYTWKVFRVVNGTTTAVYSNDCNPGNFALGIPSINSAGKVAFKEYCPSTNRIVFIDESGARFLDAKPDYTMTAGSLALNDLDQVAYHGTENIGGAKSYAAITGPGLSWRRILSAGDMVDGFIVGDVYPGRHSLNNRGQLALSLVLSDGTRVWKAVYRADPAEEVTAMKAGDGLGFVQSSPPGIDCGETCSADFDFGTAVTLSASAFAGSIFVGWSGEGCTGTGACEVTMDQARSVTATFALSTYTVTVSRVGQSLGVVTSLPGGIDCGDTCAAVFNAGTTVTLTASPTTCGVFVGWDGGGCSGFAPCTLTIASATNVVARFAGVLVGDVEVLPFPNSLLGDSPHSAIVEADDGYLYGTTYSGGAYGKGTVFRLAPSGSVTVLHSFGGADGERPDAPIVRDSDGALYGTTTYGGTYGYGTVFKIDASGEFSSLHSFNGPDGAHPWAGLVVATDGNLYGTTSAGGGTAGAAGMGTIYKIDTTGTIAKVYTFNGTAGRSPYTGLIQATDGYLYGTAAYGGEWISGGTVFRVSSSGSVTRLCSFKGTDGPFAPLTQLSDGYFYGTTYGGGTYGKGSVFKVDAAGTVTILHSFSGPDGRQPRGAVVEANDGNLYGTTVFGGASDQGVLFGLDHSGNLVTLHSLRAFVDGTMPLASLIVGRDARLYGTVSSGSLGNRGAVLRVAVGATIQGPAQACLGETITLSAQPGFSSYVWSPGGETTQSITVSPVATTSYTVTVTSPSGCTAVSAPHVVTVSECPRWSLSVALAGAGTGQVVSTPAGIDCGAMCSAEFDDGVLVTMCATPATDSTFAGWSGGGCSGTGTCTVTMDAAKSVTATFDLTCVPSLAVSFPPSADPLSFIDGYDVQINGAATPSPGCPGITSLQWDWGDGTVDVQSFPATHHYQTHGAFSVIVTAFDASVPSHTNMISATVVIEQTAGSTEPGSDVTVQPVDPPTGTSPVTITFGEVTNSGVTTLAITNHGPPPDTGFRLVGNIYYLISTDASFTPPVHVCIYYGAIGANENALHLKHLVAEGGVMLDGSTCSKTNGCWEDVTDPSYPPTQPNPDTVNKIICGTANSLSPFAVVEAIEIVAPLDPKPVNTTIAASLALSDPAAVDEAEWTWGDGSTSAGELVADQVAGSQSYTSPGTYTVGLRLLYEGFEVGSAVVRYVVVYDPNGGFVTGGGWIASPPGAFVPDPSLVGQANFGFVSAYKKGQSVPSGTTEFQFQVADLNFHSSTYEWLVVAGARAQFKGVGTIDGQGSYGFLLTAIDGALPGSGGADKFRIKIWDKPTGTVVYDNQLDAADDADPTTVIGGGSIVIHKAK